MSASEQCSEQCKFTKTHEWILVGADGTAKVGISDFAQEQVTDLVFVELPAVGKTFAAQDEAAVIESVKSAFSVYAPAGGEVVAVNDRLTADPGVVNDSPYEDGWFFQLKLSDPSELDALMSLEEYDAFTKAEKPT